MTVCVHSFSTRCDSRVLSAMSPRWRARRIGAAHDAIALT